MTTNNSDVKSVKAWKVTGPNEINLMDHVIPEAVPAGKLRIKPMFVGSCGSDLDLIRHGGKHSSHKGETKPIIAGHELCGKVIGLGAGVANFEVGDIVVVEPAMPCEHCHDCESGHYNTCKTTGYWATPPVDGCFVQELDVLPKWVFKVPANLDPMVASLTEPLGACLEAIYGESTTHPQVEVDNWILILGGGNIAMGILYGLTSLFGASKVILAARKQSDLDFATSLGCKHVVKIGNKEETKVALEEVRTLSGGGVKTVIECTGVNDLLTAVIKERILRGYGKIIGVGCHSSVEIDIALLRRSAASFVTVRRSLHKFPKTLQLLSDHAEVARSLIGRVGSFNELDQVLLHNGGKVVGNGPKTVIEFD